MAQARKVRCQHYYGNTIHAHRLLLASSSTAVAFDPNASFVITVVLVDNEENSESSPFKTKNKHTVYKVLRTACATFELTEEEQDR